MLVIVIHLTRKTVANASWLTSLNYMMTNDRVTVPESAAASLSHISLSPYLHRRNTRCFPARLDSPRYVKHAFTLNVHTYLKYRSFTVTVAVRVAQRGC